MRLLKEKVLEEKEENYVTIESGSEERILIKTKTKKCCGRGFVKETGSCTKFSQQPSTEANLTLTLLAETRGLHIS